MKWTKNIFINGKLKVLTGLHIGGGNETIKIGGTDNPVAMTVLKKGDKLVDIPYIPGSSIKGKVRKLLSNYVPTSNYEEYKRTIVDLFGPEPREKEERGISRLVFRDCFPTKETLELFENSENGSLTEVKAENVIDQSMSATPRFIERIKPFTEFEFECILSIYENDNEDLYRKIIADGFNLLSQSYLGGSGTRGYGKVEIDYEMKEKTLEYYEKKAEQ
ncbi:MAG: type III-A CRISPR-associated RAMP protein Csm3 [Thermoplasmatales archaeon]|nr:MAG: type III-A CRISPR-associated RAMP protein Csm3 [Thermoplasmatales archaeon]